MVIHVTQRLASELAGSVRRNGVENRIALGKRDFRVDSVNGGRGGDGDFFDALQPCRFEEIDGALDVDALVKGRFLQAGAHTRAGGKVDDLVEFDAADQFIQRRPVGQVAVDKLERLGQGLDFKKILALEFGIVERVQVVERPDSVAGLQQALAYVRANEAGAAGDEEIHRKILAKRRLRCREGARFDNPPALCYKTQRRAERFGSVLREL